MNYNELIQIKTGLLIALEAAKGSDDEARVQKLAMEAACLESQITAILMDRGETENAVINLVSQASCLVDAGYARRAIWAHEQALSLTNVDEKRNWIRGELARLRSATEDETAPDRRRPGHREQRVCILGSGIDESHPALHGQVTYQLLFDTLGQQRESYAAFDRGSIGTMLAGLIAGKALSYDEIGMTGGGVLRTGVAPECKLVSVAVLDGPESRESGTMVQVFAGIDWAISNRDNPVWGGYEVVLIPLEVAQSTHALKIIDRMLELMNVVGLVPILPSGNRGPDSKPLGTRGIYVGVAGRDGSGVATNGPRVDVLAPGIDLMCCQPASFGRGLVGRHSGSSLAAAHFAGCVALLCAKTGVSAREVARCLIETASRRLFSVQAAAAHLDQLPRDASGDGATIGDARSQERLQELRPLFATEELGEEICAAVP